MLQLLREAKAAIKGRGNYCGHALHIGEHVSLEVYYVPKNPAADIQGAHGFPVPDRAGIFRTSIAI